MPLTEAQWQRQVTDLAELYGWVWAHFRPARTAHGWATPVAGPMGAGFPDLVLVRERVVFVELKSDRGRLSDDQDRVLAWLEACGAEWHVWRPTDFEEARVVLQRLFHPHDEAPGREVPSARSATP
jgi:hypothetical protein